MNDLISREAALSEIGRSTFIGEAYRKVRQIPIEKPEQRWIPVTERLPEDRTRVLVTIHTDYKGDKVRSSYYSGGYFCNDNGDCWRVGDEPLLAWMPIPEPYKGGGKNG